MSAIFFRSEGTQESGYDVGLDPNASIVRARVWGFWDAPMAVSFTNTVLEGVRKAQRPTEVTIDALELRPQRDDVQELFAKLLVTFQRAGLHRLTFVVTSSVTKMQLGRLVRENGARNWVQFTATMAA
jgi:hypothetical protein